MWGGNNRGMENDGGESDARGTSGGKCERETANGNGWKCNHTHEQLLGTLLLCVNTSIPLITMRSPLLLLTLVTLFVAAQGLPVYLHLHVHVLVHVHVCCVLCAV